MKIGRKMLSAMTQTKTGLTLFSHPNLARLSLAALSVLLLLDFHGFLMEGGIISGKDQLQPSLRRQQSIKSGDGNATNQKHGKHTDPDGYFNNLPVYYKKFDRQFHSTAHCIGENFVDDFVKKERKSNAAWKHRSCKFQNLCFDMREREFVLFLSDEQKALENALKKAGKHQFWPSSSMRTTVAVGGVHPRWGGRDVVLKWYPKFRRVRNVLREDDDGGFYMLPPDHLFLPWNSYYGYNPGHIITDDFLPIYTLLSYFDLTDKELAMVHIDLPDNNSTQRWDNCQNHWELCEPYMKRFLPLLGTELRKTSTQYTAALEGRDGGEVAARYVCAAHGAAGTGMLTDHGKKLHGNFEKDFLWTHNVGRGDAFYRFRNWMVGRLLGRSMENRDLSRPPYRVVISNNSSTDPLRNRSFGEHAAALRRRLGVKYELDVREVGGLSEMSMADQVELAAGASVFITAAGGGVSIAHFLPRGASLLVYFAEFPAGKNVSTGLYNGWVMDWDTYNNFGYIRTHWLPIRRGNATDDGGRQSAVDMNVFVRLVDQELDLISHIDDYD